MAENVYLNGRVVPIEEAAVSVFDAGLLHGASIFTTMRAHNGIVFRLDRHLARLFDTVALLGLQIQATPQELRQAVQKLLKVNELREARVRITLTPGSVRESQATTIVTASPLPEYSAQWYTQGIGVVVTAFKQIPGDPSFGYKTGCYLSRVLARQEAAAKGAEEALWFTVSNRLAEACFCNVFLVQGGEVFTPPRDTPVLPGIVREAVLELCSSRNIACHDDRELTVREMLEAEEVFLTSSCSGVRPVVRIESHVVGNEKPGSVTRRIMDAYQELLKSECAKDHEPLTDREQTP